jgi:hypothetical protein
VHSDQQSPSHHHRHTVSGPTLHPAPHNNNNNNNNNNDDDDNNNNNNNNNLCITDPANPKGNG